MLRGGDIRFDGVGWLGWVDWIARGLTWVVWVVFLAGGLDGESFGCAVATFPP